MTDTTYITARARAFSSEGVRTHQFMIEDDVVRVWDPVAEHYTTCHCLAVPAQRRIRKMADSAA